MSTALRTLVTLWMYCLGDITDVLSLVTVQIYQHQWHYTCTVPCDSTDIPTSVTLQMYCPLWQYRYTNISDITDVQTSVTVRMYWLWHYSPNPIQMYLPQRHYILTWPTDFNDKCTYLSDIMAVLTPTTQWMSCTDLSITTLWMYWPLNIMAVLTSTAFWMYWPQHSGCTDFNILDVLTSMTYIYWPWLAALASLCLA